MKFLLDLGSLEGTNAERRIEQLKAMGDGATSTYQLKRNPRAFNQSNDCYTAEQKAYVAEKMQKWIHFFGYNEQEGNETTGFFKYDEATAKANAKHYYGFRKTNEVAVNKVVSEGGWQGPKYVINKGEGCFDLFPDTIITRLQEPGMDFACKKLYGRPWNQEEVENRK